MLHILLSIKVHPFSWNTKRWIQSITSDIFDTFPIYRNLLLLYSGPASKLILKLCFAVWCGITGALFIFPGLRVSRMHLDALR
jgi:hypothetical protein